jgi:hypothetical protein
MTGRRRLAVVALAACVLTGVTGCPAGEDRSAERTPAPPSAVEVLPGRPTTASTGLPAYDGPPAGGPPSAGPLTTVRAAVSLTPATPGVFARAISAVAAPGGGAYVVLDPADANLAQRLVTVGGPESGWSITGSVPISHVEDVWGMHVLADGGVVVTGQLRDGDRSGYGFQVVDPATGAVRTTIVLGVEEGTVSASGLSALAPGSPSLFLFLASEVGDGTRERLAAVDVGTGRLLAARDVREEVAAVSRYPVGRQLAGLVARPAGGVTLVFDASPTEVAEDRIPTLLSYDGDLEPDGGAVRVTNLSEGAETQAVAPAADGTVFLLVEVPEAAWVLAVPDGGGAGPVLAQFGDRIYDYALVVEPAQVWSLLPAPEGALALDLTTGGLRGPLRFGCVPKLDVREIVPAADGAIALGECDSPREDTQMLWFLGP